MAWGESKSSTGQAASMGSDIRLPCVLLADLCLRHALWNQCKEVKILS